LSLGRRTDANFVSWPNRRRGATNLKSICAKKNILSEEASDGEFVITHHASSCGTRGPIRQRGDGSIALDDTVAEVSGT
jgi:hypothetical protein